MKTLPKFLALALTFVGGALVLPALVFLVASMAGPLFVLFCGVGLLWLTLTPSKKQKHRTYAND